jgi:hypothetical protein
LEGDFGTELGGDLGMLADGIARSDFVLINFEKGRRAALVEHVTNDGYELIPLVGDGGGLVDHGYFFFVSDEDDGGDLVGGEAPFEVALRPEDPLGIDRGGGLGYGVSNHLCPVITGVI